MTLAEDTTQPHAHPAVLLAERGVMAMLEIFKPAAQRAVHIFDDDQQGMPIGPPCLAPDGVPQFLDALLPRPSVAALKMIAKKVETTAYRRVYDSSLLRMQAQTIRGRPLPYPRKRPSRFRFRPTQNHKVISVAHHLNSAGRRLVVQWVKIDVRQQRRDDRSLRRPGRWRPARQLCHHTLLKVGCDKFDDSSIGDLLFYSLKQSLMRDSVEVALQVGIHHPRVACFQQVCYSSQSLLGSTLWPKPITLLRKVSLEDRFQYMTKRRLRHPVAHRRNPQRASFFAARLVD